MWSTGHFSDCASPEKARRPVQAARAGWLACWQACSQAGRQAGRHGLCCGLAVSEGLLRGHGDSLSRPLSRTDGGDKQDVRSAKELHFWRAVSCRDAGPWPERAGAAPRSFLGGIRAALLRACSICIYIYMYIYLHLQRTYICTYSVQVHCDVAGKHAKRGSRDPARRCFSSGCAWKETGSCLSRTKCGSPRADRRASVLPVSEGQPSRRHRWLQRGKGHLGGRAWLGVGFVPSRLLAVKTARSRRTACSGALDCACRRAWACCGTARRSASLSQPSRWSRGTARPGLARLGRLCIPGHGRGVAFGEVDTASWEGPRAAHLWPTMYLYMHNMPVTKRPSVAAGLANRALRGCIKRRGFARRERGLAFFVPPALCMRIHPRHPTSSAVKMALRAAVWGRTAARLAKACSGAGLNSSPPSLPPCAASWARAKAQRRRSIAVLRLASQSKQANRGIGLHVLSGGCSCLGPRASWATHPSTSHRFFSPVALAPWPLSSPPNVRCWARLLSLSAGRHRALTLSPRPGPYEHL